MTKDKALYAFFNQFMTAYPTTSVPERITFPYMTYEYTAGRFGDRAVPITASMWFNTESEAVPNQTAEDFATYIGRGGTVLDCDNGKLWVRCGEPWVNAMNDEGMPSIKRRMLNIEIDYLTR